eukprot:TRINITY_DN10689_c0_g2_i1.p1 TRINITY_DN10689_c0_g2~~TRINITY_DN10689_c0_g2_i1.p1  ORF type:complete len:470 (-),score=27.75 TRINITY_DN10689_c0_g2_i1:122-1531(-)
MTRYSASFFGFSIRIESADWCCSDTPLLTYACENFVDSPIWSCVLVSDFVAVWLLICLLWRHCEVRREDARLQKEWKTLPMAVRRRRLWQRVGAVIRVTALVAREARVVSACDATASPASGGIGDPQVAPRNNCASAKSASSAPENTGSWRATWGWVLQVRKQRKDYLWRRSFDVVGVFSRAAGPCLILVMCCVILFEIHSIFALALPWFNLWTWLHTSISLFCAIFSLRLFFDYARASLTDPGRPSTADDKPPATSPHTVDETGDVELAVCGQGRYSTEPMRRCGRCRGPKPSRCHHCRVCRRCVLRMDHHCPFVNNCIGVQNYNYFCFFLVDIVLGCIIAALLLLPQIPGVVRSDSSAPFPYRVHVCTAFIVAVIALLLVGSLLTSHLYLILTDQTTLEHMQSLRHRATNDALKQGSASSLVVDGPPPAVIDNLYRVFGVPPAFCRRFVEAAVERMLPGISVVKRSA